MAGNPVRGTQASLCGLKVHFKVQSFANKGLRTASFAWQCALVQSRPEQQPWTEPLGTWFDSEVCTGLGTRARPWLSHRAQVRMWGQPPSTPRPWTKQLHLSP